MGPPPPGGAPQSVRVSGRHRRLSFGARSQQGTWEPEALPGEAPPPGAVWLLRQVRVCLPGKQHHGKWQSRVGLGLASVRDTAAGPGQCWPLGGPEGSREPSRVRARGWPGQCVAYPGRLPAARCRDRRQEQGRWRLRGMGRGPGRKVTRGGLLSCGDERDVSRTGHLVSRLPWSEPLGTWGPAQTGLVLGFSSKGHMWARWGTGPWVRAGHSNNRHFSLEEVVAGECQVCGPSGMPRALGPPH